MKKQKEIIYLPYFKNLIHIENRLRKEGVNFNVNGAKDVSPRKRAIVIQYFKHVFALWKLGNIQYPSWQLFNVKMPNPFSTQN